MYGKKVKLRVLFLFLLLSAIVLTVFLVLKSLEENVVYFLSPTEVKALNEIKKEKIRVGGMVKKNSIVLSTGGGIILSSKNRDLLSSRGTVFYLSTPISVQVERTAKDKDRPLLKDGDPFEILSKLHEDRKNLYDSVSDHIIETEKKTSQEVAEEIIKLVKNL